MGLYEHTFLARQDLSTAQVDALSDEFTKILEKGEGSVKKTEHWGLKTLAYKIKKNRKAHFVMMNIDAPPAAIKEMERNVALSEDVIRQMTIAVDELEEGPSVQMRKADERRERRERRERD